MGERIKSRRIQLGYTQDQLGALLGLQKSAIAKYENGRVENIKRSVLSQMSKVLDCNPSWLIGLDAPMRCTYCEDKSHVSAIIDKIESLDSAGVEKVEAYIDDLIDSGNYKKSTVHTNSV